MKPIINIESLFTNLKKAIFDERNVNRNNEKVIHFFNNLKKSLHKPDSHSW